MFKNGKEWEWTTNQVEFFGWTALVIYFVSLLCFEWNCFSFSLACFLLIFVRSWFLWNFVNYSRSSWRHYERRKKKKCPCLLLDPCVSFPALGLKTVSARSLSESAQWVFELKNTNKQTGKPRGGGGGSSQLTRRRFRWIYVEMNQPSTFTLSVSPLLLSTVHAKYSSDPDRKNASLLSGSH